MKELNGLREWDANNECGGTPLEVPGNQGMKYMLSSTGGPSWTATIHPFPRIVNPFFRVG